VTLLVTGAAGFIGSTVATALLRRGDTVHGIDNLNAYYDVRLKEARRDGGDGPRGVKELAQGPQARHGAAFPPIICKTLAMP
jgi:nucleoside-diphosphate-sugar epimerase